jgi:hypothetical protein
MLYARKATAETLVIAEVTTPKRLPSGAAIRTIIYAAIN